MDEVLIGIDEAGMGTLAGPMTAALVVIDRSRVPKGVRDSKKLTDESREELAAKIMDTAITYLIVNRTVELVDKYGISACWDGAMSELAIHAEAVNELGGYRAKIILDGNRLVPGHPKVVPIVKADATHPAVSAASILAKYHQCCWMDDYHLLYPRYRFCDHRGYGTAEHIRLLKEHGPCPVHRKSYRPVKRLLSR
jgi:ribonuclease HII